MYNKIAEIQRVPSVARPVSNIQYTYDAAGNRISKRVERQGSSTIEYTWYVRDASGNVMAVYNSKGTGSISSSAYSLLLGEQHLYGSSRLGILNRNISVKKVDDDAGIINFTRGNKFFELSNHLGNVLATISDKKAAMDMDNNGLVDYYQADVLTVNDYYPFGMMMPGRKYIAPNSNYRYGFNGKEKDNEVRGDANALDFGERSIYDPRLGRFISVDPNYRNLPDFSPYQYARNNPIMLKENGKDGIIPKSLWRAGIIDPMAAGFIDAIADDVRGIISIAEVVSSFNPTDFYFYTPMASQVRHETWETTKTVLNVMSNPVLQGIVIAQAYEKISNTIKNADFRDYQYATGYAGWQVLTMLVGVGEAKAIAQGGKMSVEVLKLISGFGKVEKAVELLEGGVKIERKLAGFADKVAVVGRDFGTNVKAAAKALEKKTGKTVELFNASEGAVTEWNGLLKKYNGVVPEDIAKGSKIYKENLAWAQKLKKEGYTVYDAGLGTKGEKGTFYGMETKEIFGDNK